MSKKSPKKEHKVKPIGKDRKEIIEFVAEQFADLLWKHWLFRKSKR